MVRTRFAPSPTGSMHIGNLRTALYAYALAKHNAGDFILRIEDTDKKREKPGGIEEIKNLLTKFGLRWDEYFVQSARLDLYKKVAQRLVTAGHAYEEEGAIRIKIPRGRRISFKDFVLGKEIAWETDVLQELVILKSDGFPTYHLAVVADDHEMKISHVLRGHDWLPSTPIHLLLYEFLGWEVPQIGHLTDILDPAGGKLSKRKGSTSCEGLFSDGYLPEAILNFIMLTGWAPKDNREIFSLGDFVKAFDPEGLQKSNPVFNQRKLDWFNAEYIRKLGETELCGKLQTLNPKLKTITKFKQIQITKLVKDRIKKLSDFNELAGFFFTRPKVDRKLLGKNYRQHLTAAVEALAKGTPLDQVPAQNNFKVGDFFMDLRVAITGSKFTPPINESIEILGKEETIARIKKIL